MPTILIRPSPSSSISSLHDQRRQKALLQPLSGFATEPLDVGRQRAAGQSAPCGKHIAGGPWLIVGLAQQPGVPQRRLILGSPYQLHAGGRGHQRQTMTPRAAPFRLGSHEIIERVQGAAGHIGGLDRVLDTAARCRPSRHTRDRKGDVRCGFRLPTHCEQRKRDVRFSRASSALSAPLVCLFLCPVMLPYRAMRSTCGRTRIARSLLCALHLGAPSTPLRHPRLDPRVHA